MKRFSVVMVHLKSGIKDVDIGDAIVMHKVMLPKEFGLLSVKQVAKRMVKRSMTIICKKVIDLAINTM